MTTTLQDTPVNAAKIAQLRESWNELLEAALRRGFHGTAAVEVAVQDGTIQVVRQRLERLRK